MKDIRIPGLVIIQTSGPANDVDERFNRFYEDLTCNRKRYPNLDLAFIALNSIQKTIHNFRTCDELAEDKIFYIPGGECSDIDEVLRTAFNMIRRQTKRYIENDVKYTQPCLVVIGEVNYVENAKITFRSQRGNHNVRFLDSLFQLNS